MLIVKLLQYGKNANSWPRITSQIDRLSIYVKKRSSDRGRKGKGYLPFLRSVAMLIVLGVASCFTPISTVSACQQQTNDEIVAKLIAVLEAYHGMEFRIETEFVRPHGRNPIEVRGIVAHDGKEAVVEKSYLSSDGVFRMGGYGNEEYGYVLNCTPAKVFHASASTSPDTGRNPFNEIGAPMIFFFGRTLGGRRLHDFFRESKPIVTALPSSDRFQQYTVTVSSKAEGLYKFEVRESEKIFQLVSVLVEETPESISSKNGQKIELIQSLIRKRRWLFADFEMQNGKVSAFSFEGPEDELTSGKIENQGIKTKTTVKSCRSLSGEIVRSTKMFSLFEIPERISANMICDSLAPHAVVNGSLVRLGVHYASALSGTPTPLRKTWFQKYWIIICCFALIGAAVFGTLVFRWMKHAR